MKKSALNRNADILKILLSLVHTIPVEEKTYLQIKETINSRRKIKIGRTIFHIHLYVLLFLSFN